jgi:hypothetical protein
VSLAPRGAVRAATSTAGPFPIERVLRGIGDGRENPNYSACLRARGMGRGEARRLESVETCSRPARARVSSVVCASREPSAPARAPGRTKPRRLFSGVNEPSRKRPYSRGVHQAAQRFSQGNLKGRILQVLATEGRVSAVRFVVSAIRSGNRMEYHAAIARNVVCLVEAADRSLREGGREIAVEQGISDTPNCRVRPGSPMITRPAGRAAVQRCERSATTCSSASQRRLPTTGREGISRRGCTCGNASLPQDVQCP